MGKNDKYPFHSSGYLSKNLAIGKQEISPVFGIITTSVEEESISCRWKVI